jgi:predicted nucleotidyltransferase
MQSDEFIKIQIKEVAQSYFSDADVMLFGSRAKETAKDESDYDVLIIIKHSLSPDKKLPIRSQIRKDLLKQGIRSDILIQSQTEVEKKKKLPGHLIRNIMKDAILL